MIVLNHTYDLLKPHYLPPLIYSLVTSNNRIVPTFLKGLFNLLVSLLLPHLSYVMSILNEGFSFLLLFISMSFLHDHTIHHPIMSFLSLKSILSYLPSTTYMLFLAPPFFPPCKSYCPYLNNAHYLTTLYYSPQLVCIVLYTILMS